MATQPSVKEDREHGHGHSDKPSKSSLVVVELAKPRSREQVRRLRKGHGKLVTDIEDAIEELVGSGTVKAGVQPVVIVVREATPALLWALDYDEDEDVDEEDDEEEDEEDEEEDEEEDDD
jgi:Family of unknown function (DUF6200)